ncbi:hypothetical protein D3C85_1891870 [compost metagenome]
MLEAGDPSRITFDNGINLLDRTEEDVGQQHEGHELADSQLSLDNEISTAHHDKNRNQPHHHIVD